MATTLVIVEFLIVGFQVCVWVGLLIWQYSDLPNRLPSLKEWAPLLATCALALAYTLGVVFDRFVGALSSWVQKEWKRPCESRNPHLQKVVKRFPRFLRRWLRKVGDWLLNVPKTPKPVSPETPNPVSRENRFRIILEHREAHAYWEQVNRQIRLLRATCVNGLICAVIIPLTYPNRWYWCVPLLLLVVISGWAWRSEQPRAAEVHSGLCNALPKRTQSRQE